jgi:hypothetical protein
MARRRGDLEPVLDPRLWSCVLGIPRLARFGGARELSDGFNSKHIVEMG